MTEKIEKIRVACKKLIDTIDSGKKVNTDKALKAMAQSMIMLCDENFYLKHELGKKQTDPLSMFSDILSNAGSKKS